MTNLTPNGPWIPSPLDGFATARPDHPALICAGEVWTALQWRNYVARFALELQRTADRKPVMAGELVTLVAEATPRFLGALQALWWLGAIPVVVSSQRRDAGQHLGGAPLALSALCANAAEPWDGELSQAQDWNLAATKLVLLTSGSTGAPKSVELSGTQMVFSVMGSSIRLGHLVDDGWLSCLPLHHIGGLAVHWRTTVLQTTTVLVDRFEPAAVLAAIATHGVTMMSVVPDMLRRLLAELDGQALPASLRVVLVGGERCPDDLLVAAARIGLPIAVTWGMSETASQVATRFPGDARLGGDAGPPVPFVRVRSTPSQALAVEGPVAPSLGDDSACVAHFVSSDCGSLTLEGRVHISGRVDSVFVSGGENVSPAEVEDVLRRHPSVEDVAVVPVPDERWGLRPAAWVVTGPDIVSGGLRAVAPGESDIAPALVSSESVPTPEALRHFCADHLERFQVPVRVVVTPRELFPRTSTGKVDRALIARTLEEMQP